MPSLTSPNFRAGKIVMKYMTKLKKILISALAMSASVIPAMAETVSQRDALGRAATFFNAAYGQVMSQPKLVYTGKRLTTQSLFIPFYVYNHPAGGFVIISAENKALPILGYSLTDSFDESKMGDKTKALLKSYARDIERIRYDSRNPDDAIQAWNDYPHFVDNLLRATYDATDPTIEPEQAAESIEAVVDADDPALASVTYTPAQWQDIINDELTVNKSAAIGIYSQEEFLPTVAHGRRGDYYRFTLDSQNNALFRLFATEFLSDGEVAAVDSSIKSLAREQEQHEPDDAFRLYEDFAAEIRAEKAKQQADIENALIVTEPVVNRLGGGHFEIKMPENIDLVRIYNLAGSRVRQYRFADTSVANIDISPEPTGLYIVLLRGISGKPYGLKIAR